MSKVIFHIDMDSFFVSCERSKNESLINKPVVIASNLKRAIVTAMSYEVKNAGFKTGDPFYLVKYKIKDLIVIEPHYQLYSLMSKKIFNFLEQNFSKKIEIYSIDECYLDVTNAVRNFDSVLQLAKTIQEQILKVFKIPCSIGISYTKFLAKMSTNKAKPFGILQTKKEDIEKHFFDLSVKKIFGIGKASAEKLIYNNINTYSDLVNCQNDVFLKSVFGKNYFIFIQNLKGLNITKEHVLPHEVKSISNSETFMVADSNDENYLINELKKIVKNVCERANNSNLEGNEITVSLIQKNKLWNSKHKKIGIWTNNYETIWNHVFLLFKEMWRENEIRGLGIALRGLRTIFNNYSSLNLFELDNKNIIDKIINEQNFLEGKNQLKTLYQYSKEKQINTENIKFLRKNSKTKNKTINLEEKWK